MLNNIIAKDKELLIYLNNFGSEQWDGFWLFVTNQFNWSPLFIALLILIFYNFKLKKGIFLLLFLIVLIAFSDQFTNLIKSLVGRTRPCNTISIQEYLRPFSYKPRGGSYWSGHACLSTTITVFFILLFRKQYKVIYLLIFFPIIFGYSRIYLGVHYPLDVTSGYIAGILLGFLFFQLFKYLHSKIFKENFYKTA